MEDTIAAIATPPGEGGIGIIRISGSGAKEILSNIFSTPQKRDIVERRLTYGHIINPETGNILDEVLAVYMKAPFTYTAEDVVEIDCHGGIVPLKNVLSLVLEQGARMAEQGEFTKRAFLNGRLDLSQAEAVIDVIRAKTDRSFDVAMDALQGGLSETVNELRNRLMYLLANITVSIDYPEEDVEEISYNNLIEILFETREKIDLLLKGSETGKILRDGISLAIIGKPNVGKSSLMNNLLRESRAIVTEIPGTTRDTIEESVNIRGIPVKITDTAGIRETEDKIEKIGIEKSKKSFNEADLVLFLIDTSRELDDEDREILCKIEKDKTLIVLNKIDRETKIKENEIKKIENKFNCIRTSMKNFEDTVIIEDRIYDMVFSGDIDVSNREMVTNVRHIEALRNAKKTVEDGIAAAQSGEPFEIIEIDVSSAYESLGFITGDSVSEDIIDEVFSRFCLGK